MFFSLFRSVHVVVDGGGGGGGGVWFMDVRVQMYTHGHTCRHQSRLLNALSYCCLLYCLEMSSLVVLLARLAGQRAPRFNLTL